MPETASDTQHLPSGAALSPYNTRPDVRCRAHCPLYPHTAYPRTMQSPIYYLRYCGAIVVLSAAGLCNAQTAAPAPGKAATKPAVVANAAATAKTPFAALLPELINADTVPKVLAKFTPSVTEAQVVNSDYLLLDAPPIAPAGLTTVHLKSELPGTDLFLLFNAKPRAKEPSLLSATPIAPLAQPEIRVPVRIDATTDLLLIARANGLWYKVRTEIKIAEKDGKKIEGKHRK